MDGAHVGICPGEGPDMIGDRPSGYKSKCRFSGEDPTATVRGRALKQAQKWHDEVSPAPIAAMCRRWVVGRQSAIVAAARETEGELVDVDVRSLPTAKRDKSAGDPSLALQDLAEELGRMAARLMLRAADDPRTTELIVALALFWLVIVAVARAAGTASGCLN